MSRLVWSDDLDLGVDEMNIQHKILIQIMTDIGDASDKKAGRQTIINHLQRLEEGTIDHFQKEEAYMEKISFPDVSRHALIHKSLIKDLKTHISNFKNSQDEQIPEIFFNFLKMWLTAHIKGIDMKYAKHSKVA